MPGRSTFHRSRTRCRAKTMRNAPASMTILEQKWRSMVKKRQDLAADRAKELFDYDPETGVLTWKVAPSKSVKIGNIAGNPRKNGYLRVQIYGCVYLVHRVIFLIMVGRWP